MGQPDGKLASQAWLALDFQPAFVGIDQITGNAQTQAHTLGNAPLMRRAVEGGKNLIQFFAGNSRPCVANSDPDFAFCGPGSH